jgi:uncharacterized protein (TIGR02145 family)
MKPTNIFLALSLVLATSLTSYAQVGIGTSSPNAALDVTSTTQGFLPPRMSAVQRNAIATPAQGLMIYCTTCGPKGEAQLYNGTEWENMSGGAADAGTVTFDNFTYTTVQIGTQVWMVENLRTSIYANGYPLTNVTDATAWSALTSGAWADYNNDSQNGSTYGKLYNWHAVASVNNLCPTGWHVPTDAEWTTLSNTLGGSSVAGGKMKSTNTWQSPNTNATNESGFSGLPGGLRLVNGTSSSILLYGQWWSSTENSISTNNAWYRWLYFGFGDVARDDADKKHGLCVRCLRD